MPMIKMYPPGGGQPGEYRVQTVKQLEQNGWTREPQEDHIEEEEITDVIEEPQEPEEATPEEAEPEDGEDKPKKKRRGKKK